ncbi:hypothetical protein [Actinomadura nitritigenes]|uniref:hypothetical protein n=1 Tax=Actinomadura nitritigenes TaxID=134602 RepID=UPI003D8DA1BC
MTRPVGPVIDDVAAAGVTLQRRFPGSTVWFGKHTFRWWAMLPQARRWVLVEAATPVQLAVRMNEVLTPQRARDK